MAPVEDSHRGTASVARVVTESIERLLDAACLRGQFLLLRPERVLGDGTREVGVQETILHVGKLGLALPERRRLARSMLVQFPERGGERLPEPVGDLPDGETEPIEVGHDRILQIRLAPADHRMVVAPAVVRTTVVHVLAHTAAAEPPPDALARHRPPAARASEQPAGQRVIAAPGPPILAIEDSLALVECAPIDKPSVSPFVSCPVPPYLPDVEPVVQDVRKARARESTLARPVHVAFRFELVCERSERVPAGGVQLEDAHDRAAAHRIRLHGFIPVVGVHVPVRRRASGPALTNLLVHPLEHLGTQIVAVVLRDGGHHVEREGSGRTRPEFVVHEEEADIVLVLEFLQPHGVAHVPADAVELVGEDRPDALAPSVRPHPLQHGVERHAIRAALR